jgi:hypothetical protein
VEAFAVFIQPIDYLLICWFVVAFLCAGYVAWDQFKHNPEPAVMKWAFILVTLYLGPVGLLLYMLADQEPVPGTHEEYTKPLWKQGIGSTMHCIAGDATGILIAATITAVIGVPMWGDIIIEYIAGFTVGLFIFQALFMRKVMGGSYLDNVRGSFIPELVSMSAMMSGMVPVMAILMMGRDMRAMWPGEMLFWAVMALGIGVGFAVAYPFNVWLVSKGLKHGLMTVRPSDAQQGDSHADHRSDANAHANATASSDTAPGMAHMAAQPAQPAGAHSGHARPADAHGAHAPAGAAHDMSGMSGEHAGHDMSGEHAGHGMSGAADEHAGHDMKQSQPAGMHMHHGADLPLAERPTRTQVAIMVVVTTVMLLGAYAYPFTKVNMHLSAHDVGGLVMPPGMIMDASTPAEAMQDMAAVDPRDVDLVADQEARGAQTLEPTMDGDVKVFDLETSLVSWSITPEERVDAMAVNGQVPGPTLRVREGDNLRINVTNKLDDSTSIHWHGLILPNDMDGVVPLSQDPIQPGETFTYEFEVVQNGTYFYHSHDHSDRQQSLGIYGALIIDPGDAADEIVADHDYTVQLQEWLKRDWLTYPAMPMEGALPNYFTINGKSYPDTDTIKMKVGETVRVRFIGTNTMAIHPMHIHGGPFEVVAVDGETLAPDQRYLADTINIGPGQHYDVVWTARRPGKWLMHCHIPHHTTNNNTETDGGGGLMMVIDVTE